VVRPRRWAHWPWFILRSSGFVFELVEGQHAAELRVAIDHQLSAKVELESEAERLLETLDHRNELGSALGSELTRQIFKPIRARAQVPLALADEAAAPARGAVRALLERWNAAITRHDGAAAAVATSFDTALLAARKQLRAVASSDAFKEAVYLSSRGAADRIGELADTAPTSARNNRMRAKEDLAAFYLQRFTAKNDTISFFGPYVWGKLTSGASSLVSRGELVDARQVYFEHWAIEALAKHVRQDPEVLPFLRLALAPYLRLEGEQLIVPGRAPLPLDQPARSLLAAVDGTRTAVACAELATASGACESRDEALLALRELIDESVLRESLRLPTGTHHPEDALRAAIAELDDACATRGSWLARLDELRELRDRFACASPDERRGIAVAIEGVLSRLSVATHRGAGQVLVGRDTFYEDCRRAVSLELGHEVTVRLAPLEHVYAAGRWMISESIRRQSPGWLATHAARATDGVVPFIDLGETLGLLRRSDERTVEREVVRDCRQIWRQLVAADDAERPARRIQLSSEELERRLGNSFVPAQPARFHYARFSAPDVQIVAESWQAIESGHFQLVLGEVHVAWNGLCMPALWPFCPVPEEAARRFAGTSESIVRVVDNVESYHRAAICPPLVPGLIEIETSRTPARVPPERRWRAADLIVIRRDDQLFVRHRDRGQEVAWEEVVGLSLAERLIRELPGGLMDGDHVPRLTVDHVVLQRERWTFSPSAFPESESVSAEIMSTLRRFQIEHGLPDYVFARVPEERKPFLLDFGAPLLVEGFLKTVAKSSRVELTEMLPGPQHLWLRDERGRYTAELRMVADFLGDGVENDDPNL
jgi:hypothetical protein